MKDNGEKHFEFVHHNVSMDDMNDGKLEYTKFGKVNLNNCVSLSHSKILQRAHQWAHCCMKKHLGATLPNNLFHMCKSGQFYPNSMYLIPLHFVGMNVRRATSI
jgi:hypothetical protein